MSTQRSPNAKWCLDQLERVAAEQGGDVSEPFRQICENMADHFDKSNADPPAPESAKSLPAHLEID